MVVDVVKLGIYSYLFIYFKLIESSNRYIYINGIYTYKYKRPWNIIHWTMFDDSLHVYISKCLFLKGKTKKKKKEVYRNAYILKAVKL